MKLGVSTKVRSLFLAIFVILVSSGHAKADFVFGESINLGSKINTSVEDGGPSVSADGLSLYFYSFFEGFGNGTLRIATRETTEDPWEQAVNLESPIIFGNSPCISADELSLYFEYFSARGVDIFVTNRASIADYWSFPVNLGKSVNSTFNDIGTSISGDGLELFFGSDRSGDWDIHVTTRTSLSAPWETAVNLGPTVNSSGFDGHPCISLDGLALFFCSDRPEGFGDVDIWMTRRATLNDDWGMPVNLGSTINTSAGEAEPSISSDGRTLYFSDWNVPHPGGVGKIDLWQVSIEPIVDFNTDGIIDCADMCIMVDHWGENYPLCDIGPMPWGDGIVDVQDLIALSEHLFENVNDPTLIAHWALDEIESMTAHDNVSGNEDFVMGNALWQPNDGKVNGAIEMDGVDDCIIGSVGPNPAEGPCSVIAWIKGGAPGQVVISQPAVADFLAVDSEGNLMTGLNGLGQSSAPLSSQTSVADGQWHRIGLVWDGSRRALFVDGVKVAEDTEDGQGVFGSGLYIGVGKDYMAGTFFSGLVDDIRIYNRVVSL